MKLYCCYTPAHEVLFQNYFLLTIPKAFNVISTRLDIAGAGDFLSPEFLHCIGRKMELVIESIRENWGETIIWSDVDVQFYNLQPNLALADLGKNEVAFQRETKAMADVNTGFFICLCNAEVLRFFELVVVGLLENQQANEQWVINNLLQKKTTPLTWDFLPLSYYARTHGWPPPRQLALYHANWTKGKNGVAQKIRQFRELTLIRRLGFPALVIFSIKYAPRRLWRLLSKGFKSSRS